MFTDNSMQNKVATSSQFREPNRTKFSKCNPNLTKPITKNLDPNQKNPKELEPVATLMQK
jgi:hypothetical protein